MFENQSDLSPRGDVDVDEGARVIDENVSSINHAVGREGVATIIAVGMDVKDATIETNEAAADTKNSRFYAQSASESILTGITKNRRGGSL